MRLIIFIIIIIIIVITIHLYIAHSIGNSNISFIVFLYILL